MEIAKVRAEIKSWERAFRAENIRDPTVDDIKANHQIGSCISIMGFTLSSYKLTIQQPIIDRRYSCKVQTLQETE